MKKKIKNCKESSKQGDCELCNRTRLLTKHHLIPCAVHQKGKFNRKHTKEEMRSRSIKICKLCHDGIHRIIPDEKQLGEYYNTKELLLSNETIAKHVAWSRKQKCCLKQE